MKTKNGKIDHLKTEIKNCKVCEDYLLDGCRPVVSFSEKSKIILIGQAPGIKVHLSGIPWDDKSGENLRKWLGVTNKEFYDPDIFGIIPMGFCFPGKAKSGDKAPRHECAPLWHKKIMHFIANQQLCLLVGNYAQKSYLKDQKESTLTETVKNYSQYLPDFFPLPHPSPRNNIWMKKNIWFLKEIIPVLQKFVRNIID